MQMLRSHRVFLGRALLAAIALTLTSFVATPADAQVTAFKQAVAEAAAKDKGIAAFYQANKYESIWTGRSGKDRKRREALLNAVTNAADHGLPVSRYNPQQLQTLLKQARSPRDRGAVEVEMSRIFLQYSRDLQTGVLTPSDLKALRTDIPSSLGNIRSNTIASYSFETASDKPSIPLSMISAT